MIQTRAERKVNFLVDAAFVCFNFHLKVSVSDERVQVQITN
jgi:hypothetical protein